MSKRLQVVLSDEDAETLHAQADRAGVTVSEWVRRSLRDAARTHPSGDVAQRLAVVRAAAQHEFPTADIDDMLGEIERGYG